MMAAKTRTARPQRRPLYRHCTATLDLEHNELHCLPRWPCACFVDVRLLREIDTRTRALLRIPDLHPAVSRLPVAYLCTRGSGTDNANVVDTVPVDSGTGCGVRRSEKLSGAQ